MLSAGIATLTHVTQPTRPSTACTQNCHYIGDGEIDQFGTCPRHGQHKKLVHTSSFLHFLRSNVSARERCCTGGNELVGSSGLVLYVLLHTPPSPRHLSPFRVPNYGLSVDPTPCLLGVMLRLWFVSSLGDTAPLQVHLLSV